jgi:hypothetical protein
MFGWKVGDLAIGKKYEQVIEFVNITKDSGYSSTRTDFFEETDLTLEEAIVISKL